MKHASVDRAKRVDSGCRNHGSCPYCRRSRTHNLSVTEQATREAMAYGMAVLSEGRVLSARDVIREVRDMACRWPDCHCESEDDCEMGER